MQSDNIYTRVALRMMARLDEAKQKSDHAKPTSFMHEKIKPSELLKRMQKATPGQRKEWAEAMGPEAILELLGSERNGH